MYYLFENNLYTTDQLPNRIRLHDGSTRTDPSSFTQRELFSAGFTEVPAQPSYDPNTERLLPNSGEWIISRLSEAEIEGKKQEKWAIIRRDRDGLINAVEWRINRYLSEIRLGLEPTDNDISQIDNYIQKLRDITNQADPFNIIWPELPS